MVLNGHAATDAQAIGPPFETVTMPVPQLPMSSPLNAAPPVRLHDAARTGDGDEAGAEPAGSRHDLRRRQDAAAR